jgi:hypothetical protein
MPKAISLAHKVNIAVPCEDQHEKDESLKLPKREMKHIAAEEKERERKN